jgi:hypothetical protein
MVDPRVNPLWTLWRPDKVLQVAAWGEPENPEQSGRRVKFECESTIQVSELDVWKEYVRTYMPYCLHINDTQYEYENRSYEAVSAASNSMLSIENTRREYVYDGNSQNDLPHMVATFRTLTKGLTCAEPGPHPETVKLLRRIEAAIQHEK